MDCLFLFSDLLHFGISKTFAGYALTRGLRSDDGNKNYTFWKNDFLLDSIFDTNLIDPFR
jgi:hypothetical protein